MLTAAQRGLAWAVPRMRHSVSVTGAVRPSGTRPPSLSSSCTEKSTRKLAQQAPQRVQGLSLAMPNQSPSRSRCASASGSPAATIFAAARSWS